MPLLKDLAEQVSKSWDLSHNESVSIPAPDIEFKTKRSDVADDASKAEIAKNVEASSA